MIRVRLLLFASLRDLCAASEVALELPDAARVADAWSEAVRRWPALESRRSSIAIAVNGALARRDAPLSERDEVAFLPPVSGG